MIGFSSIMHMGYLFLGVACWNVIGVTGAVVLMVGARPLRRAALRPERRDHPSLGREPLLRTRRPGQARAGPRRPLQLRLDGLDGRARPRQLRRRADGLLRLLLRRRHTAFCLPACLFGVIAIYGTVITAIFQLRAIKNVFYGPMPARYQPQPAAALLSAAARQRSRFPA